MGCGNDGYNIGVFKLRTNGVYKSFLTIAGTVDNYCKGIVYDDSTQ